MAALETKHRASFARRMAAAAYECILLFAIAFFASMAFRGATDGMLEGLYRNLFQLYLFLIFGLYFMWCWLRGGQTLPMKTWKLILISVDGSALRPGQCAIRYIAAWFSVLFLGIGFVWALFDKDRQFLHDRLAGTRIVMSEPAQA